MDAQVRMMFDAMQSAANAFATTLPGGSANDVNSNSNLNGDAARRRCALARHGDVASPSRRRACL